ncbi:unnamed protein product, partial [Callosobruchus maculatus]
FCPQTVVSYVASNGSIELLEQLLELPGVDPNKPDNEGNTPLHFAAQAGIKSRLRKVFRTSSGPDSQSDALSSARLVTQLTSAALCASSPVLPSGGSVPPVVKSLIRPLTVPRLQITLVNNNGECPAPSVDSGRSTESGRSVDSGKSVDSGRGVESGRGFDSVAEQKEELPPGVRPARTKKKK